jgi:hypothetical protein
MLYLFPTLVSPGAEAETSLSEIPAKEIDIGLTTPLYTTFILSAEIVAALGLGTTILPSNFKGIVFPSSTKVN